MSRSVEQFVDHISDISSLPAIYVRINEVVNNPQSCISEVAKIVSEDAGLTARLLRLVNSSFFSFPTRIETVSQACVTVGLQHLRALALSTSVMSLFRSIPRDVMDMNSFWRHNVACGVTASILAQRCDTVNSETTFAAGILHDVGRIALCQADPERMRVAISRSLEENMLLFMAERAAFGFDHAAVNSELFRRWQFPVSLEEATGAHHTPMNACRFPVESAIVHFADIIVHCARIGSSGERFVPPLDARAWRRIGLPPSDLGSLVVEVEKKFSEVIKIMLPEEATEAGA